MISKKRAAEIASVLNARLERFMPVLTPSGVVLGFLLSPVFIHLRFLVPWLFAIMTLSGSLKLRVKDLSRAVQNPFPILLFFFSAHGIIPLLAFFGCSFLFKGDADTVSGYVLLFSVPTAVSGFIWVSIYRGDNALALAIILLDTLAAPLVVPGTISLLLGTKVHLDMTGMTISLILMVVLPTIIGVLVNETSKGKVPAEVSPFLNPFAKVCIVLVIAANASAVVSKIQLDDPKIWLIGITCILFAALGYGCSKAAGIIGRLSPEKRIVLFFATGLRNLSAATTIAIDFLPDAAALPPLLGIVFQQTMAAIMGKILLKKKAD